MRRSLIVILVVCLILAGAIAVAWIWFSAALGPADPKGSSQSFSIAAGESSESIATNLDQAGIIRSALTFRIYTALEGLSSGLQAGTYELSPADGLADIARELAGGDTIDDEVTVVIPEGLTNKQLADLLAQKLLPYSDAPDGLISAKQQLTAEFLSAMRGEDVSAAEYAFLADRPSGSTLEGYLFPDTYRFYKTAKPIEIRNRLLATFDRKVPAELRSRAALIDRSFSDVLILASILEKELRTSEDRQLAADLFWRRLDAGIALQSDATVNYVTGKSRLQPTADDLKVESPYNTYLNPGLPPGPISNPGRDAIEAALDPKPNDSWYYLNDPSGKTHFAKTFAEHTANKAKYLQ